MDHVFLPDRIEARYRDDGFVAARVIVPSQSVADGVVQFKIYEGRLIGYEIRGEVGDVEKQIRRLLDNLVADRPARWSDVERYLLLARDLPGISLTGTLQSAGDRAPGGVVLVVDVALKSFDGFVSLSNQNAVPTGAFSLSAGGALNSQTEYAERIGAIGLAAFEVPEQLTAFVTAEASIGSDGLVGRMTGTFTYSEPGDTLKDLNLVSDSFIARAELEYPMVRSRSFSLWSRGGFEYIDQHTSIGGQVQTDDQLRVLFAGIRGVAQLDLLNNGLTEFDLTVRKGLTAFGGSDTTTRRSGIGATGDFQLLRGSLKHTQPLLPFLELFVQTEGQVSDGPVLSIEKASFGELTIGRGYEPGSLTGDRAIAASGEVRFIPPCTDAWCFENWYLKDFEPYAFFDWARTFDVGSPTGRDFEELYSAGFGVRFKVLDTFFGDIYYAQPLTRALSNGSPKPDPTVKFNFTQSF